MLRALPTMENSYFNIEEKNHNQPLFIRSLMALQPLVGLWLLF
jgi:hypothetical protein